MDTIFSILALVGMGYGAYVTVRWLNRAGQVQFRKVPPLSPRDLQVLEETADRLMVEMKAIADECVERIERAVALAGFKVDCGIPAKPDTTLSRLRDAACPAAEAARDAGVTTGEIELIRGLRATAAHRE